MRKIFRLTFCFNFPQAQSKTTNLSAWDNLKGHADQHVVGGKVRCCACSEYLSAKKNSTERDTISKKHKADSANLIRNKKKSDNQRMTKVDYPPQGR